MTVTERAGHALCRARGDPGLAGEPALPSSAAGAGSPQSCSEHPGCSSSLCRASPSPVLRYKLFPASPEPWNCLRAVTREK